MGLQKGKGTVKQRTSTRWTPGKAVTVSGQVVRSWLSLRCLQGWNHLTAEELDRPHRRLVRHPTGLCFQ
jgi:hypothetical protein